MLSGKLPRNGLPAAADDAGHGADVDGQPESRETIIVPPRPIIDATILVFLFIM